MYFAVFLINFISTDVILDLSYSLIAEVLHPYNDTGNTKVFYVLQSSVFLNLTGF